MAFAPHFHSSGTLSRQTSSAALIAVDEQSFVFVPSTLRHLFILLGELIWQLSLLENRKKKKKKKKMISGFF